MTLARRLAALLLGSALLLLAACDSAEERVRSHYDRGTEYVAEGKPKLAIIEFTNALRIDENYLPAHRALAGVYEDTGKQKRAAAHLKVLADADPKDLDSRRRLGRILLELGDLKAAQTQIDQARALAPEDPETLGLAAAAALMGGDTEAALAAARKALDADPAQRLARLVLISERIQADDPSGALALLDAAPEATGDDAFGMGLIRIRLLESLGDRAAVGRALQKLAQLDPKNESVRLAIVRWRLQGDPPDIDGAEADLRALAAAQPGETGPALRVVDFLRQTRGPEAARAELERLAAGPDSPEDYELALAGFEASAGDAAAATARLEKLIAGSKNPDAADRARLMLARVIGAESGQGGDARRAALIGEVLTRDPGNVEALAMRASARLAADDYEGAIEDLRAALKEAPDTPDLYEMLATAHERNGAPELAAERRALAVRASKNAPGPSLRYARQLVGEGKAGTAESVLLDALRGAPSNVDLLTALAQVRLAREDWAGARQAIAALEKAGDGGTGVTERLRAAALSGEGRMPETLALLEKGWETRRGAGDLAILVQAYVGAGETAKAETLLRDRLEADPGDVLAMALLAQIRAAAGAQDEAEALLRRAVAAQPGNPGVHDALYRFLETTGQRDKAAAALAAGLAAAPDAPALRFHEAMRLEATGDYDGAIAIYEALHETDPGDLMVANNLASLLSDHHADDPASLAKAVTVAKRLRGAPYPAFQDTYGWTLFLSGDEAGAVATLRRSAEALSDNAIAQHHLAMAYLKLGQSEQARQTFARAIELADAGAPYPQRAEAEAALAKIAAEETAAGASAKSPGE